MRRQSTTENQLLKVTRIEWGIYARLRKSKMQVVSKSMGLVPGGAAMEEIVKTAKRDAWMITYPCAYTPRARTLPSVRAAESVLNIDANAIHCNIILVAHTTHDHRSFHQLSLDWVDHFCTAS